jgi:hypothetical protein
MFDLRRRGTVIAEGLKIVGSVTAEGLVEVNGRLDGDLYCTSLRRFSKGMHKWRNTSQPCRRERKSRGTNLWRGRYTEIPCCRSRRYRNRLAFHRTRGLFRGPFNAP